jgi:hypothetical protein
MPKKNRAEKAGEHLAESIIEMVHMMYQKRTATRFMIALVDRLHLSFAEWDIRNTKKEHKS